MDNRERIITSINVSSKKCKSSSPNIFVIKQRDSVWLKSFWGKKVLSRFQALESRKFSCLLTRVSDVEAKHPRSIIQSSQPCLPCLPDCFMPLRAQINCSVPHIRIQTGVLLSMGLKMQEWSCRDVCPTSCILVVPQSFPTDLQQMVDW